MSAKVIQSGGRAVPRVKERIVQRQSVNTTIPVTSKTSLSEGPPKTMREPSGLLNRVIIVESDTHARLQFKEILQSKHHFQLVAEFSNATEALNTSPRLPSDLILLSVCRRDPVRIKCINLFKRLVAGLKVVMVLSGGDMDLLEAGLQSGADHCLVKPVSAAQCLAMLEVAVRSPTKTGAKPQQLELESFHKAKPAPRKLLNAREGEVMCYLAAGLLYKEIADKMVVSEPLVRKLVNSIFQKFQVHNRSEAIGVWFSRPSNADQLWHPFN